MTPVCACSTAHIVLDDWWAQSCRLEAIRTLVKDFDEQVQ